MATHVLSPGQAGKPSTFRLTPRWKVSAAVAVVLIAALLAGVFVRLPLYSLQPGPARDVVGLVHVEGDRTFPVRGALLLTTVAVSSRPISLLQGLASLFDPATELVPRSVIVSPGLNDREQDQLNTADMLQSKYAAAIVALRSLGRKVERTPGARIVYVFEDSPSHGVLRDGDVIVAVDDAAVTGVEGVTAGIRRHRPGQSLRLTVDRGGRKQDFTVRTRAAPDGGGGQRPVVGISLAPAYRLPVHIEIDTQDIGGPSGGLVFALTIVDVLTEGDLTKGHVVAATGTIDLGGEVGEIGGIEQKVRAAEHSGAGVFIVPAGEAPEARKVARRVQIIGVRTLDDALQALASLPVARNAA